MCECGASTTLQQLTSGQQQQQPLVADQLSTAGFADLAAQQAITAQHLLTSLLVFSGAGAPAGVQQEPGVQVPQQVALVVLPGRGATADAAQQQQQQQSATTTDVGSPATASAAVAQRLHAQQGPAAPAASDQPTAVIALPLGAAAATMAAGPAAFDATRCDDMRLLRHEYERLRELYHTQRRDLRAAQADRARLLRERQQLASTIAFAGNNMRTLMATGGRLDGGAAAGAVGPTDDGAPAAAAAAGAAGEGG
ncbi:hypothetical protein PLESTF_001966000 [Pleodorina starrii]|nr:hypothetical protein PLESTM_001886500 [Pleodorina starrii]GLC77635.1 hypothetical protein PLESTF_001966000 [Pleodorina starrii]